MTDKEFKRLSRSQLIDIIYLLQMKQEELTAENEKLKKELEDKRLRISKAGSIAEAALEMHHVMQSAQDAASHYLEEIRMMRDETEEKFRILLENARKDAAKIVEQAERNLYGGSGSEETAVKPDRDDQTTGERK